MNNEWLDGIKSTTPVEGRIETKDADGAPITLEWKKAGILSPDLAHFKKTISELASEELSRSELQFLRTYPEAVSQELFLKSCAPLLECGPENADWDAIKEKIQETIKQFYLMDLTKFAPEIIAPLLDDIYIFATLKNQDELLGFILFSVTPALTQGNIKLINLVVRSTKSHLGLEKILLNSIFKLLPQTTRIFVYTRPSNETAIQMYHSFGFTEDTNPFQDPNHKVNAKYLTSFDYKTNTSTLLQGSPL